MQDPKQELLATDALKISSANLDRVDRHIELADRKARLALTVTLAILAAILASVSSGAEVVVDSMELGIGGILFGLAVLGFFVGFLWQLITGLKHLLDAVSPRLDTATRRKSLFYFGTIRTMELTKFKEDSKSLSYEAVVDELDDQTYANSQIAGRKYSSIDNAFPRLAKGTILALIYLSLVGFGEGGLGL